jgi:hypothetical protein
MKRNFFLAVATAIIYFGCAKKNDQPSSTQTTTTQTTTTQTIKPKTLFANAGLDTTICLLYGGIGNIFKGMVDGRASHDDSGKIVSYSWFEIIGSPPNSWLGIIGFNSDSTVFSKDSSEVTFLLTGGIHQFMLEVRDDHGQVDSAKVNINAIQKFDAEYDGLSWDSTTGVLTTISVKAKPGLIESWPDFTSLDTVSSEIHLSDYNGKCNDISSWKLLPYVPYDSIQLTDKLLFYTLISDPPTILNRGHLFPEIYAKTNSGIDFNQKVSIGFIERTPWDY